MPDSPLDAELIKLRLAECRFLRAYIFYSMVKRYGAFPMLTVVPNASAEQMKERMEAFYHIIRSKHLDTPVYSTG